MSAKLESIISDHGLVKKQIPSAQFPSYWVDSLDMFGEPALTEVFQWDEQNSSILISEGLRKYTAYALDDGKTAELLISRIAQLKGVS